MTDEGVIKRLKKQERKWFLLLILLGFCFCIAYFNFVAKGYLFSLTCTPSDNQCVVAENHVFDNDNPERRTFLLSDVEDMRLHVNDKQQYRLYVYVKSEPVPIDQDWTNEYYDYQTETVTDFHQFLKTNTQRVFSYQSKTTDEYQKSLIVLGVFFLLMFVATICFSKCRNKRLWLEKQNDESEKNKE